MKIQLETVEFSKNVAAIKYLNNNFVVETSRFRINFFQYYFVFRLKNVLLFDDLM